MGYSLSHALHGVALETQMRYQRGFTSIEAVIAIAVVLGVGGWIANIVKLIGLLDGSVTAMFVARCVGVFVAPLGSVLGFF